jgi:hypothetical protein
MISEINETSREWLIGTNKIVYLSSIRAHANEKSSSSKPPRKSWQASYTVQSVSAALSMSSSWTGRHCLILSTVDVGTMITTIINVDSAKYQLTDVSGVDNLISTPSMRRTYTKNNKSVDADHLTSECTLLFRFIFL